MTLKMNISSKELDKILVSLLERDLIVYDMGKKVKVSLKSLHKKLYETFQVALSKEQESLVSEKKSAYLKNIYEVFEKQLNRTLSPLEFSMIGEWVNDGFDDETIIRALNEALAKGKKTIRSVDRILVQYKAKEDMEKTGMSNVKEVWDDDMESLLEVAKAKWIDD